MRVHTRKRLRSKCLLAGMMLLLPLAAGCSYNAGAGYTWGSIYRQDIRTVAVPVFRTRTFSRGDELALTQALVNQIESRTPYKVVPIDRADTVIEGEVVGFERSTVSQDPNTSLPQEQIVSIWVDFAWKDLRTGRVLVERRNFEQSGVAYPTLGEGLETGRALTIEGLAASIVEELQREW